MATEQIEIEIVLDDGSVQKGFANIKKESEKAGKSLAAGIGKNLVKVGAVAATAALAVGGVATAKGVAAAREQADAVNALATALEKTGDASRLTELEAFASELQSVTTFGDEAIISQLAFAKAMGASTDQSKEILTAAADMSAALGIDLNSSVRNISKTLGGYAGELGEVIPELKELTQEQLQNGEGVALLAKRYQGFAQAEIKTFGGAMTQLTNAFGDFLEGIGDFFVKSPTFIKIINAISKLITGLGDDLKKISAQDFIDDAVKGFVEFSQTFARFVLRPLEVLGNFVVALSGVIVEAFNKIKAEIQPTLDIISGLLDRIFGKVEEVLANARTAVEEGDSPFANIFDTKLTDDFVAGVQEAGNALTEFTEQRKIAGDQLKEETKEVEDTTSLSFMNIAANMKGAAEEIKVSSKDISKSLINGMANAAGSAFASFGKAIAEGENALDAFINSLIASMGQMAIQLGTQFILQGLAYLWAGLPNGPSLIAAGGALAAFGGILSAVGGAGGTVSEGQGTAAEELTPTIGGAELATAVEDEGELGQQQAVTINVEGTVIDPKTTGENIAGALQEFFDSSGGSLVVNT